MYNNSVSALIIKNNTFLGYDSFDPPITISGNELDTNSSMNMLEIQGNNFVYNYSFGGGYMTYMKNNSMTLNYTISYSQSVPSVLYLNMVNTSCVNLTNQAYLRYGDVIIEGSSTKHIELGSVMVRYANVSAVSASAVNASDIIMMELNTTSGIEISRVNSRKLYLNKVTTGWTSS